MNEDLDTYFLDFGKPVVFGSVSCLGILDSPDSLAGESMVISSRYSLTAKTSDLGSAKNGDSLTVDGVPYVVQEVRKISDGSVCEVWMLPA